MKTQNLIKAVAGTFLLMLFTISIRANDNGKNKFERMKSYVNNRICYPYCKNQESVNGIVLVEYSVQNDGSLYIKGINASNQKLRDYVENQFNKIKIKDTSIATDTSFISKYVFIDENDLNKEMPFEIDPNLKPQVNYLTEM